MRRIYRGYMRNEGFHLSDANLNLSSTPQFVPHWVISRDHLKIARWKRQLMATQPKTELEKWSWCRYER